MTFRLIKMILIIIIISSTAFLNSILAEEAKGLIKLKDKVKQEKNNWQPFLNFYTIGALRPHSAAITVHPTSENLKQWKEVKSELKRIVDLNSEISADASLVYASGLLCFEKRNFRRFKKRNYWLKNLLRQQVFLMPSLWIPVVP